MITYTHNPFVCFLTFLCLFLKFTQSPDLPLIFSNTLTLVLCIISLANMYGLPSHLILISQSNISWLRIIKYLLVCLLLLISRRFSPYFPSSELPTLIFLTFLIALKILVSALCFSLSNWMWNSVLLWSLIPPLEDPLHEVSTSHWFMPASKNYKWHCLETSQYDLGLTLEMYEAVEAICYQLYSLKEIS